MGMTAMQQDPYVRRKKLTFAQAEGVAPVRPPMLNMLPTSNRVPMAHLLTTRHMDVLEYYNPTIDTGRW